METIPSLKDDSIFRAITERTTDLICICDADANIKYASPSYEVVLGYSTQQLIGTSSLKLVHPDDLADAHKQLAQLLTRDLNVVTGECRLLDAFGEYHYVDFRARNLLSDPAIRGIVMDARDITERRKTEEALRVSEERFRKIIEVSAEGIVLRDADGQITFSNERFAQMLGYRAEELVGKNVEEIISAPFLPRQRASAKRRRETGE